MNSWAYLMLAILAEVVATSFLKSTEGFTRAAPSAVVVVGYAAAFYFLSLALRTIPVGIAYAVWSGIGIALVTLVAFLVHGQKIDAAGLLGIGLIVAGVAVLSLSRSTGR